MSTKLTIKRFFEPTNLEHDDPSQPKGFHVYLDILDDAVTGPTYLELTGVEFTAMNGRVTVAIPPEWAALLGLPFERAP